MGRTDKIAALTVLLAFAGCASGRDRAPVTNWRAVVTDADRERIRSWRETWTAAVRQARAAGHGAAIDAAGPLLQPDASLGAPMPRPGDYVCRVFKLGRIGPDARGPDFIAEPPATCRIEPRETLLGIAKLEGPQRPAGWLYPDAPGGQLRMIFLGSMRLADERRPLGYGVDPERDMAGILERIGTDHWRLALPRPRWDAVLTVVDIRSVH
ncbi:MAG: hypothetical protein JWL91_367 [Sphingomonas bacterium]|jgi:hypothetical protein|nr:DUF4893 domain-containing protein [Sphingomonas bacterium]MDB5688491.1 hypothetical protein [Sphingomonas bacterium]